MEIYDYYILLITIVMSIWALQYLYELNLEDKLEGKDKCSYCGFPLGRRYTISWIFTPTIYACSRWWCKIMRKMGYLTHKPRE